MSKAKVTSMKVKVESPKVDPNHKRHNYAQLSCVINGFYRVDKTNKDIEDTTKVYTTLYCTICGETKEVVAATGMLAGRVVEKETIDIADEEEEDAQDIKSKI